MAERRLKRPARDKNREETWKSSELKPFMAKKSEATSHLRKEGIKLPLDTKKLKSETRTKDKSVIVPKETKKVVQKQRITTKEAKHEIPRKPEKSKQTENTKSNKMPADKSGSTQPLESHISKLEPSQIPEDILDTVPAVGMQPVELQYEDEVESYAEDFESYDEDFEEVSSGTDDTNGSGSVVKQEYDLDLIKQAIDMENQKMVEQKIEPKIVPPKSEIALEKPQIQLSGRGFIKFHIPKTEVVVKDPIIEKTKTRLSHLMPLLVLDFQSIDLIEISPLSEYDVYIKQVGRDMTRQVAVQCNDDIFDRETQTDTIFTREKWTQHSTEGGECSCGIGIEDTLQTPFDFEVTENSSNFLSFFFKTSEIMCIVLDENTQNLVRNVSHTDTMPLFKFTQSNPINLNKISILEKREIVATAVSKLQPNSLLIAYAPSIINTFTLSVARRGILAHWNINDAYQPKRFMECESTPTCCCFSPQRLFLAFAGMDNGSICVWDFRDTIDTLTPSPIEDGFRTRPASYSTAMLSTEGSHMAPICSIVTISRPKNSDETHKGARLFDDITMTGLSFQIASIDILGVINIWVVAEVSNPEMCGSLVDLGMAPGARVKLIRSTSIAIVTPSRANYKLKTNVLATLLKFHPIDLNHYYIATLDGLVMHGCRHTGKPPIPKSHGIKDQNTPVTSLDFHPMNPDYFIVSYAGGFFALYNREYKLPIMTCPSGEIVSLKRVMWSRVHPLVVYTLSEKGELSVWDLSINHLACISKEKMCENIDIINFDLIPERSTSFPHGEIVLSLSDGSCQIHPLKHLSSSSKGDSSNTRDELEAFTAFVTRNQKFM